MKPLPFSETFAHPGDPLYRHLQCVSNNSADAVIDAVPEVRIIAFTAGLFHDVGKGTRFFQLDRLKKGKKNRLTTHSACGAVIAWWFSSVIELPLWMRLGVLVSILKHHGDLNYDSWEKPLNVYFELVNEPELLKQLNSIDLQGFQKWLQDIVCQNDVLPIPSGFVLPEITIEAIKDTFKSVKPRHVRNAFKDAGQILSFLAGFGGLLSADKIDAAIGEKISHQELPCDLIDTYKKKNFCNPKTNINVLREKISAEVKKVWMDNLDKDLFTLTSPTGSGKTLSIFNAALSIRETLKSQRQRPSRIIYCLPFTSVIDQNHQVLADVLKTVSLEDREDMLLKHHHLVEGVFRTKNREYDSDGTGQLLTETWQSEIVVTTFYQLLHSILSTRNGELKRAGQLCGSIILMDEVQAIPLKYWKTLRHILGTAADILKSKFVLLTATRPLIFQADDPEICEILPNHPAYFKRLSRVKLYCHQENIGLIEFTNKMIDELKKNFRSTLIIVNRRKSVTEIFRAISKAFPAQRIIALSTNLTPWDRRARIRLIRSFLRRKIPCIAVSTQLVEAGVDVSFPIIHREIAPLDSVIQACGRSNRHGKDILGNVHVWKIYKETEKVHFNEPLWKQVYDGHLIDVTTEILNIRTDKDTRIIEFEEKDFLALSKKYFELCWDRVQQIDLARFWINGNFNELKEKFQLIPEGPPTATFFVVKNIRDQRIWDQYLSIQNDENLNALDKKIGFNKIRKKFFERVIQVYAPKDPERDPVTVLNMGKYYLRETGFDELPEKESTCVF